MKAPVSALLCGFIAGLVAGGCYAPSYEYGDGELRCDQGACPPAYQCGGDGQCHRGAGNLPDAPSSTTIDATAGSHADAPSGAVCSGSQTSCATPTQPQHCSGGRWVADTPCGADTPVCDNGACGAACVAPASRCRDPRTVETCNGSGFWEAQPTCAYACVDETAACGGECIPFGDECRNGNELWECGRDGKWALKTSCAILCENGSCGGDCSTGDTRCDPTAAKVPQTCLSGHWQGQGPCAYACLPSGSCAPQCDPAGAPTCIGGDAYSCGADGNWTLAQQCATNCSAGACTGTCSEGTKQCSGVGDKTPETCTGGLWVDGTACEFVCSGGACAVTECHPNVDKKCEGGFPNSCDASGHFAKGNACVFVCDGNQCGGICAPGTFRCNGSTNREKCADDGKSWTLDQACTYGCSGTTCNACTPDPNTCLNKCGSLTNNCGTTVNCGDTCAQTNGPNWVCDGTSHACACTRDVAGDCAGKCGTITDRCGFSVSCSASGNGGVACNGTGQICQANGSCCTQEAIGVTCSGDPGDDCSSTVANNCGVSVNCSSACDAGFTCGGGTPNKCTCHPGAVRCSGNVAQTCNASGTAWGQDMTCSVACIDGTGCGSCVPSTTACCDSTHVKTCGTGGTYGSCSTCTTPGPACRQNEKTCGGVCAPGAEQCGTDGSGNPAVLKCDTEGQWTIVVQTCSFTCTGGSTNPACSGECHPSDTLCSDATTLKTCGSNFMYTTSSCPNGCGAPAGGNATCCTETDAQMCPATSGASCGIAVTKPSCGLQVTCSSSCANDLLCGGNSATPNQCSCSPNTRRCVAEVASGGTALLCNAGGTAYTPTGCTNGCTGGSCCLDDVSYCHGSTRRYCTPHPYCNRTANCSDDCASQFPTMPTCGAANLGQCGCHPGDANDCNEGSCDSDGVWHPGSGCAAGQCCCSNDGNDSCAPVQGCAHGGGSC